MNENNVTEGRAVDGEDFGGSRRTPHTGNQFIVAHVSKTPTNGMRGEVS